MNMNLPTRNEWEAAGFDVPSELCRDDSIIPPQELMRAAIQIDEWFKKRGIKRWELMGICSRNHADAIEDATLRLAAIIDRESGLAELLEAAKDAQCDCSPKERDSGHKSECWFPALQNAIAKATNPNADVQQVAPGGRWTEKGTV